MLNGLHPSELRHRRRTTSTRAPQPTLRGAVRRPANESDSTHWKQLVEAEARHRLKRTLSARRK